MANIHDFREEMQSFDLQFFSPADTCITFSYVSLLPQNTQMLQRNCLYVGSSEEVASFSPLPEHCIFLLVEDGRPLPENLKETNTVIVSRCAPNTDILFFQSYKWLSEHTAYLEDSNLLLRAFLDQKEDALRHLLLLLNPPVYRKTDAFQRKYGNHDCV